MGYPWGDYGRTMGIPLPNTMIPWATHGLPVGDPWETHESAVETNRKAIGDPPSIHGPVLNAWATNEAAL